MMCVVLVPAMILTRGRTMPSVIILALISAMPRPTPASLRSSSSFRAASCFSLLPSIFTSGGVTPWPATSAASSSLPWTCSSSLRTAFTSPAMTLRTMSAMACLSPPAEDDFATAAGPGALGFFSASLGFGAGGGARASAGIGAGGAAVTAPKRYFSRVVAMAHSSCVIFAAVLGAPFAASASRSSCHSSGRGVKSTHLPSGIAFHQ
mmetsp:Transcript_81767/g.210563  ORF Transcript_81767/g.210563 Transcript_81767/m.210563 type:complete len:207 (-) Transcript_81767:502-1122(-)